MVKPLNRDTASIAVKRPLKILQFGSGNFLRGFFDWMVDILNEQTNLNAGVQIIQTYSKKLDYPMLHQEGLYHVLTQGIHKGKKVDDARLISCVQGITNPYLHFGDFLDLAINPDVEFIVSNTTEAGIAFDFDDRSPDVFQQSFPGKLTALLYKRFIHYGSNKNKELHILPCELIEENGVKLKETVMQYVAYWQLPEPFTQWLDATVHFYNTLVDRIVPGFPKDTIAKVQQRLGYEDSLVVKTEPFHLWVIEGPQQLKEKLAFEKAGLNIIFTDDLTPYRTRKVRILNGAHTAMVPIAYLHGFREVREVVDDEGMATFIDQIIFDEIIPTLDTSKEELESFAHDVLDRFRNPFMKHQLIDIALNSISKFKVRVLPSLLRYIEKYNKVPSGLAKAFAYLILFYKGRYQGQPISLKDDEGYISYFEEAWSSDNLGSTIDSILSNEIFWGEDLRKYKLLPDFLEQTLEKLYKRELRSE